MVEHLEDLKLSILVPFVLENLLDGHGFARLGNGSLKHHAEGTVADDFLSIVGETLLNAEKKKC